MASLVPQPNTIIDMTVTRTTSDEWWLNHRNNAMIGTIADGADQSLPEGGTIDRIRFYTNSSTILINKQGSGTALKNYFGVSGDASIDDVAEGREAMFTVCVGDDVVTLSTDDVTSAGNGYLNVRATETADITILESVGNGDTFNFRIHNAPPAPLEAVAEIESTISGGAVSATFQATVSNPPKEINTSISGGSASASFEAILGNPAEVESVISGGSPSAAFEASVVNPPKEINANIFGGDASATFEALTTETDRVVNAIIFGGVVIATFDAGVVNPVAIGSTISGGHITATFEAEVGNPIGIAITMSGGEANAIFEPKIESRAYRLDDEYIDVYRNLELATENSLKDDDYFGDTVNISAVLRNELRPQDSPRLFEHVKKAPMVFVQCLGKIDDEDERFAEDFVSYEMGIAVWSSAEEQKTRHGHTARFLSSDKAKEVAGKIDDWLRNYHNNHDRAGMDGYGTQVRTSSNFTFLEDSYQTSWLVQGVATFLVDFDIEIDTDSAEVDSDIDFSDVFRHIERNMTAAIEADDWMGNSENIGEIERNQMIPYNEPRLLERASKNIIFVDCMRKVDEEEEKLKEFEASYEVAIAAWVYRQDQKTKNGDTGYYLAMDEAEKIGGRIDHFIRNAMSNPDLTGLGATYIRPATFVRFHPFNFQQAYMVMADIRVIIDFDIPLDD